MGRRAAQVNLLFLYQKDSESAHAEVGAGSVGCSVGAGSVGCSVGWGRVGAAVGTHASEQVPGQAS